MGDGENSAEQASTPKAERKQPAPWELSARIVALESRLKDLEAKHSSTENVVQTHQKAFNEMVGKQGSEIDSRSLHLLGALWTLAQDPHNSSAWDRFRNFLRAAQKA